MKKDINIEKVTGINLAVTREYNAKYDVNDWQVFLMNQKEIEISMIIVVIKGYSETKSTTVFRKMVEQLPPYCSIKLELIQPELFALTNEFQVTFYEGDKIQEINFQFLPNSIDSEHLVDIPDLGARGIYATIKG